MRREHRIPELTLTEQQLAALDESAIEAYGRRFVFGLGRGAWILIRPRRHDGAHAERVRALVGDLVLCEKTPPDAALGGSCVACAGAVAEGLRSLEGAERHLLLPIVFVIDVRQT